MRTDVIESLLIGGSIGLFALLIHAWTDTAAPYVQVLALLLAAVVLVGVQLALRRRHLPPPNEPGGPAEPTQRQPRGNQFLRELNSDWIGLEGPAPTTDTADTPENLTAGEPGQPSGPNRPQ